MCEQDLFVVPSGQKYFIIHKKVKDNNLSDSIISVLFSLSDSTQILL